MLCDYGCGNDSKFTLKNSKNCCSKRPAGCAVLKQINAEKTKQAHADGRHGYTYNAASAWSKGKPLTSNDVIFVEDSKYANEMVKQRIVKDNLLEYKCVKCGINIWQSETIVLDLDHINGNNRDNRLINLRYLCPNCHSQTDTYKGRNKNSGKVKITDQELLAAYAKCSNIRQALLEVGLAAKGGNYERMKRLIAPMVE